MRVLILGADGYLGWPTAMHFAARGDEVAVLDNMAKRVWEAEVGAQPLWAIPTLQRRLQLWKEKTGKPMKLYVGDIAENHRFVYHVFEQFRPEAIIHYAEQPSAPYSMISRESAVSTQRNNVLGTLNVLFAMKKYVPDAHLIKLGTMGEYGTPNIDIEEGYITIEHNGRSDRLPFPKMAGSFYHWSKVHDSGNIMFAAKIWDLRATDLNQGVVYGIDTPETLLHPDLRTSFHYDGVFGTALNRFCVQAVAGIPLTLYGTGGQKRGFLNINDTLQCVAIAADNPAERGEFRVFNQFTEVFTVAELAERVVSAAGAVGIQATTRRLENPRIEKEDHYYNPKNDALLKLGLKPRLLSQELVDSMLKRIREAQAQVDLDTILPAVQWKQRT